MNRKYYIDNIRILCILMLFPFHSAYIFNNLNEQFYINGSPSEAMTAVDLCVYPWWMTGLFVLAGISAMYALKKRSPKEFLIERVKRLLVPLLFAILVIIPPQCYFADLFHNGYSGNYFEHYKIFFSISDISGYDGRFTPANAWFILFLFVYSIVLLPLMSMAVKKDYKINSKFVSLPALIIMGLIIAVSFDFISIGGKSIIQFALCILFGFFVISDERAIENLSKHAISLGIIWIVFMILREVSHLPSLWGGPICYIAILGVTCFGILGMLGLGKRYLDREFFFTKYFARAEFALFLIHQTFVVIMGYVFVPRIESVFLCWLTITVTSFILSIITYEVCRRFKLTRFLLSIK